MTLMERFDEKIKTIEELQTKLLEHGELVELEGWIMKEFPTNIISMDVFSFDIYIAGTKKDLQTVWAGLRTRGWKLEKGSKRPEPNDSSWSGWWRRNEEDATRVFLTYSSKVCRRVKVGERTVTTKEDIYETVCGEEVEPGVPPPAEPRDDDIPF